MSILEPNAGAGCDGGNGADNPPVRIKARLPRFMPGGILALLILGALTAWASPFANQIPFTQPDGTAIVLWGQGDEFYAVFETLDGYTVVFHQPTQAYEYAQLSPAGDQLLSTGVAVGQGNPVALGLKQHLRINPEAVRQQVAQRFANWDQVMGVSQRWSELKAERQLADLAAKDGPQLSPPSFTTTGVKLGLTLLIDFSDDVGTIPQAEILNFSNGDSYTGYGNNGSVKKYYLDNSNNQLTYSNVVTLYIRVPLPKTNYNDTTIDCGAEGRALITAAINAMKALSNYTTTILPTFSNLTVDASSQVLACNVFFAGNNSGVWSFGLWPHSWVLASGLDLGNGKKVYKYQITNIGTSLALGTFCHENGHMLCGFPDIYDYGYDSYGGAGIFCLMGYGGSGGNPVQICAYLKRAAGWATTVSLTSSSNLTASVSASGAGFNKFYRYAKPTSSTEYYLVENRQKAGRDANLPASGIAIWHVDELGNKDYQNTNFNTIHTNYEVSLIQADNLWHFQKYLNSGDSKDLYFLGNTATGYANRFSDTNAPSARWWDGASSGLIFHHFSASGTTMTFGVGTEGAMISFDTNTLAAESCAPGNGAIDPGEVVTVNFGLKNVGVSGTANLVATLLVTNGVTAPSSAQTFGALLAGGAAVSRPFTFTANGSCGGICTAVFQLQDGTTNLGTISYAFTLGAAGSPAAANYSSGGVAVTISDNTTVEVPLTLTNVGAVADVNVRVRLNHTYDADLNLELVHPDGTVISLATARGSSGDNFGSGATDCTGTFTVFDDSAGTAIGSGAAPFAGSYVPEQLLSALNGKSVTGTWKLRVTDTAGGDVGTIYCFQLDLTSQSYVCCSGVGSNVPPVLASIEGAALSYLENQSATALSATLTASDDGSLTNATVNITSGFASGEDVLALSPNPQNGISAAYAGGVLTLTGATNAASYQAALRSVTYSNTSDAPSPATRTVTFTVKDAGGLASGSQSRNITVTTVNDAPSFAKGANQNVSACSGAQSVSGWAGNISGGPSDESSQALDFIVTNNHNGLFAVQPAVNPIGTLTYTLAANSNGVATVSVKLHDNGGTGSGGVDTSAAQLFTITVADSQNPVLTCSSNLVLSADAGQCSRSNVVFAVSATDNCVVTNLVSNPASGSTFLVGTTIVTNTATDSSGNTSRCLFTVTILDAAPPTITGPTNLEVSADPGQCHATGVNLGVALATNDNCGILTVTNNAPAQYPKGQTIVTWTAVDSSGNLATCEQTVTVADSEAPQLTCPVNIATTNDLGRCSAAVNLGAPLATNDNCGILTVTNDAPVEFPVGTNWVTWTAVDTSGNISTCGQMVIVQDVTPPVLTCATNKTVECGVAWNFDEPTALDDCCGTNLTLTILSTVTNGDFCQTIITRTWEATDCCSNSATCSQTVTITDTMPPVLICATNKTVECGAAWGFDEPTALDACCGTNLTLTMLSTVTNGDFCQAIVTRTWEATDCCSHSATGSQTVTITDTTPPVLTCATSKTVECGASWNFDEPTALDACCGTNLTLTILSTVTNGDFCQAIVTRTWEATDCCTNSATCSQTVTITDTTPPVLTCATNKTVECGAAWSFDEPTALDGCCGPNLTLTILNTVTNGDFCQAIVTRTWEATDGCTNAATCSQTVTVTPAPPPAMSVSPATGLLTVTWLTVPDRTNWVEYTDNLSGTNWIVLTNVAGSGGPLIISDGPISGHVQRYYRLRVQ